MLERILNFSIEQRLMMVLLAIVIAALGIYNFQRLPIDAVPDITNKQVVINTAAPALSPIEVEKQITFPIEWAMGGIPGIQQTRSLSKYGLSQVTVIFDDSMDIYLARQLVNERLTETKDNLPPGIAAPVMGPISTGLGEIYMWTVEADPKPGEKPKSLTELRTIQDWVIRPQLRSVAGVAEINAIGGYEKQYHVTPDPMKLIEYGVSLRDVVETLAANNANMGAGYIEHNGEQYLIRSAGTIQTVDDIARVKLGAREGIPFFVKDVAEIGTGLELRTGAANHHGQETVLGTAIMLTGENSRAIARRVHEKIQSVNKTLPEGVKITTVYDRTSLVEATLRTVSKNLVEGAILVIAILFLMLGNVRAAFIVALAIPLSMLMAVTGMVQGKISGNLMSLGAIDFGLIVDGTVVMVENLIRRLSERQHQLGRTLTQEERFQIVKESAIEVRRPAIFGELIIAVVYLPILTLSGIEGKMFIPMAQVVLLALAGAFVLTFTVMPALASIFLTRRIEEGDNFIVRGAKALYRPILDGALKLRWVVLGVSVVLLAVSVWLAGHLGSEFVPKLREGSLAIEGFKIPSISLTQSIDMQKKLELKLRQEFPDEIEEMFSKTGTAEVAVDPDGPNNSDTFVILKPMDQWKKAHTYEELSDAMEKVFREMPGQAGDISQPIEMRFNDLIAGVKAQIGIKVYGDDMQTMLAYAKKIKATVDAVPGADKGKIVEQLDVLPVLSIDVDRAAIARLGLNVKDVQDVVATAVAGTSAGQIREGDRRYELIVRLPESARTDTHALESLPIPLPVIESSSELPASERSSLQGYVPLSQVAHISLAHGPDRIDRENGKRRVVVQYNVHDRDLGGFVEEAQARVEKDLGHMPEGYWVGWGGEFENLISAKRRLTIVVPIVLALIFILLYATFNSVRFALVVFSGVPLAMTGGIVALWLRGIPFSISAGVGFIALSGVAVLNGLVMLTFINQLRQSGRPLRESVVEGSLTRLRPVLMTALVASLGFVPMALATGTGAEVQRPLATVVIGGLISATLLTLVVLPVLYLVTSPKEKQK